MIFSHWPLIQICIPRKYSKIWRKDPHLSWNDNLLNLVFITNSIDLIEFTCKSSNSQVNHKISFKLGIADRFLLIALLQCDLIVLFLKWKNNDGALKISYRVPNVKRVYPAMFWFVLISIKNGENTKIEICISI